jgi:hypothetical protein
LLLSRDLVAFVWQNGSTRSIISALAGNISRRVSVSGGRLILVNTGRTQGLARIRKTEKAVSSRIAISEDQDYEEIHREEGTLRMTVSPPSSPPSSAESPLRLFLAGGVTKALLYGRDGRIYHSSAAVQPAGFYEDLPIASLPNRAGELIVSHSGDFLKVWIAREDDIQNTFVHGPGPPNIKYLRSIALSEGETKLEGAPRVRSFSLTETQYVRIDTIAAGISGLYDDRGIVAASASGKTSGSSISAFLGPGDYRLYTRAMRGNSLSGVIHFHRSLPVSLEPGKTDLRIIGPSEIQAFRFRVRAAGKVGIGLQAETDALSATLFSAGLRPLKRGRLLFADLEEGTYYLAVHGDSETVRYRPILLGLDGSLREVPEDTIRRYVEEAVE